MRLKEIYIKNFRAIEKIRLRFDSPGGDPLKLCVLAGKNGCGKTSVLEAALLLLGRDDLLEPAKTDPGKNSRKASQGFELYGVLQANGRDFPVQRTARTNRPQSDIDLASLPVGYFSSWRYPKLVGNVAVTAGQKEARPPENQENRLWLLKQYLVNLTASKAFDDSQDGFSREKSAYERVNRIWRFFYPHDKEKIVAGRVSDDISDGFDIFLTGRTPERIPVDGLSSGEIEILSMLGQSIRHPLHEGILFIDEPELHLHASWHRAILRALRETWPQTQILCASHSQEVLDSVYSYERFTLIPEPDPRIRLDRSRHSEAETEAVG